MDAEHVGLREIKKQMTRDSIAAAALKLTVERGLSEVTIEEIAQEAFVSPRTVSNYFGSKEEAVLAAGMFGAEEMFEAFREAPNEEQPLTVLCKILTDYAAEHPEHLKMAAQVTQLEEDNPTLKPYRAAHDADIAEALTSHVAERTSTDPTTDLYPALVAAGATSAMVTSLNMWTQEGMPENRLPELVKEAFNILSGGYRKPATSAERDAGEEAPSGS